MAGANTLTFNDENFETEVLQSDIPVLVDFWATWCPPCKMIAPIVDELADEFAGKLKVGKVDTDEATNTRDSYKISSIPTLLIVKGGEVVETIVGFTPKEGLVAKLQPHLV